MQNKLLLLRCRKYLLRKYRKKIPLAFFSEKNFLHELLEIAEVFSFAVLDHALVFLSKKYFLFSEQALLGYTKGYTPFEKNFVNRLYLLFTLNSNCNCVTARDLNVFTSFYRYTSIIKKSMANSLVILSGTSNIGLNM